MRTPRLMKKYRAIIIAAICGALFFDGLFLATDWLDKHPPAEVHPWYVDLIGGTIFITTMIIAIWSGGIGRPLIEYCDGLGFHHPDFIVYSLLSLEGAIIGAILFWAITASWRTIFYDNYKPDA